MRFALRVSGPCEGPGFRHRVDATVRWLSQNLRVCVTRGPATWGLLTASRQPSHGPGES